MSKGPYELVRQMVAIFDELSIPYALGGSVASSMLGEPRSTVDVDFAVVLGEADWFRRGDGVSDRQWRDVVGILTVHRDTLDDAYLESCAHEVGLTDLLAHARADSGASPT